MTGEREPSRRGTPAAAGLLVAVLLAGWGGAACQRSVAITGTYELVAINGARLPVQAARTSQAEAEIVGGSLTLNPDGSYAQRLLFQVRRLKQSYPDSAVRAGTYERRLSTITFHAPGGNVTGQLAGPVIAVKLDGWTYTFRKAGPSAGGTEPKP